MLARECEGKSRNQLVFGNGVSYLAKPQTHSGWLSRALAAAPDGVAVVRRGGENRLAFHGVDRILPGTSTLLREPGRINLTLRRVTPLADLPR